MYSADSLLLVFIGGTINLARTEKTPMGKNKDKPEHGASNILRLQPPVTKSGGRGCPKRAAAIRIDPMAQEGLRLFKTFFAIEDVGLRNSLLVLLETIAVGSRTGLKRDRL